MKKFWGVFLILLVPLLFPLPVFAVDFTINQTEINAQLKENGDVKVVESHTYEFDGEFNGITRQIIPKKGTSITNVNATENGKSLKLELEDEIYKIYRSGEDEVITIELSYIIEDGVEVYSDMGQFYWPFFDSSNESDYEQFTVYVHPPNRTVDVIAYGFDEAQGAVQIQDNGSVVFHMGKVESGKNGDIRVAYDRSLFPHATIQNGTIQDEIMQEKQELIQKQENFESRQEWLDHFAAYLVFGLGFLLFLFVFFAWRKVRHSSLEAERQYTQISFLPREIMSMPATIYYFRSYMTGTTEMLTAALMDLLRKEYIVQRKNDEYLLVNRKTEHKHEAHLIRLLFDEIGEDGVFRFKQLEVYIKSQKNQENFQNQLHNWFKLLKDETDSHQLFEKHKGLRWTAGLLSLLFIPLMILFGIHQLYMWILTFALLMIGFILYAFLYQPKTIKGRIIKKQWKQFKQNFAQLHADRWSTWSEDDQERALIFSTGLNDKKLKEKNKNLIEKFSYTTEDHNASSLNILMLLAISQAATTSFSSATEISAQTSGTGPTPGTGTGVGGGGGGSGAF